MRPLFLSRSYRLLRLHWRRLLSELLVVFIGVYGAFMLNSYRESQHERQVRLTYLNSFKAELGSINAFTKSLAATSDTLHMRYQRAIAAGERPLLGVHPELIYPINMLIIRSAFHQGHFEVIGSKYVVNISNGSNIISLLQQRVDLFQEKSRELLLHTGGDPALLYAQDGSLKPAYHWYLQDLAFLSRLASQLQAVIEKEAITDIERLINEHEQ
ncbi:hypothetical protein [Cesiribacter andamanensis]|uniref:Uncharacterized protein n=1 Tax=Cesiribacter andamanensis AMV16 TaxID=1279009 RepID=M7NWK3_9BACT|nr:hypothetical protein [Cesiribacter andamanensis]EMR02814.1 hypothetical protein ADICEAN_02022 [Cesiribacter andamanensis AMV16]